MGLSKSETFKLVDALRRSLLYQTPSPVFLESNSEGETPNAEAPPDHYILKLKFAHYMIVMQLIQKHGGWDLSGDQRADMIRKHEERARRAYGDGTRYDFSDLSLGDLCLMQTETAKMPELAPFHAALGDEILDRKKTEAVQ